MTKKVRVVYYEEQNHKVIVDVIDIEGQLTNKDDSLTEKGKFFMYKILEGINFGHIVSVYIIEDD